MRIMRTILKDYENNSDCDEKRSRKYIEIEKNYNEKIYKLNQLR